MKRYVLLAWALMAAIVRADPPTGVTNYFTQGVIVTTANTNSGVTGLTTGTLYFAIAINEITNTQYTATMNTNDIRSLSANLVRFVQAQIDTNTLDAFAITDQDQWTPTSSNVIYKTTYRIVREQKTYYISE